MNNELDRGVNNINILVINFYLSRARCLRNLANKVILLYKLN